MPYPAPVGYRMPYDKDGTAGFYILNGIITTLTPSQMIAWNDESVGLGFSTSINPPQYIGLIFPELRDLQGYYIMTTNVNPANLATSTDTTNGLDGTWTVRLVNPVRDENSTTQGIWRTNAQSLSYNGIKAIRFQATNQYNDPMSYRIFHVYGKIAAGQNPNRLIFWDATLDTDLSAAALDPGSAGDVTRGQTYDKTFRIKNNSTTMTATDTIISFEVLTDVTPSLSSQFSLSYNGGAFSGTCTIPSLAPGAISLPITLRYIVSDTAQTAPAYPRLAAEPTTYA